VLTGRQRAQRSGARGQAAGFRKSSHGPTGG
jgi:hypothetical protein